MSVKKWIVVAVVVVAASFLVTRVFHNGYFYFAAYTVLQYIILATGWNILGGYTGYVNFGTGAFYGVGAYTAAALVTAFGLPLPLLLLAGGAASALLGMALGYLTMRVKGIYFSISTLALSVVTVTIILNTPALGGATGLYIFRPREAPFFGTYIEFLFTVMTFLSVLALFYAWLIETSWIGRGLAAIRDDEVAAESTGVPVLKLKVFATTSSGLLMGVAGAPFPYFITFLEPVSTISLDVAVNSLAMPIIGGTTTWLGPLVGALLLSGVQQITTVTVSGEFNLLIVGVLLVGFVILAPEGLVGLVRGLLRKRSR
ncbi:MAG: branched-chain amino acid ABC transporter permease [SAR324 cluster bacterium]|nr:branched-chain amino acid ABC transporter permease [SAR324 cluster bacterium]